MKKTHCFIIIFICIFMVSSAEACRFWLAAGKKIPHEMATQQLLNAPNSLKNLGEEYSDGWSVGYYDHGEPLVFRGVGSAFVDDYFNRAVYDVSELEPSLIVAHLRRASSGCKGSVANPHPFERVAGGKTWLFGHNGGIPKSLLFKLIGDGYLQKNLPTSCDFDPPESWIDSELYFIYVLKMIEKSGWNAQEGLKAALNQLRKEIKPEDRYLNFFLTDGQTLWVYREGNTLFYNFDKSKKMTFISSTVPDYVEESWQNFPEGVLGVIEPGKLPEFVLLTVQPES